MFSFDNTHIFTGYLKQLLGSTYIPSCKIYTKEFADYYELHGKEDPRVVESFDTFSEARLDTRVNYLKNNTLVNYHMNVTDTDKLPYLTPSWKRLSKTLYMEGERIYGLTKTLKSYGSTYDRKTHEYLGEYLRFIRDYYRVDLMSLYNCFSNQIINNLYLNLSESKTEVTKKDGTIETQAYPKLEFSSYDSRYRIYAVPVKLFSNYTIAIDSYQGAELFCGFYNTSLDGSKRAMNLVQRSYRKVNKLSFNQPYLYDALDVKFWNYDTDISEVKVYKKSNKSAGLVIAEQNKALLTESIATRWDILAKESDLKLFIKVPSSCDSSITILEGDYRSYNDFSYRPSPVKRESGRQPAVAWNFISNTYITNFEEGKIKNKIYEINPETGSRGSQVLTTTNQDIPSLNDRNFKPISRLQLLAYNTGESYPFADRLVEYLTKSAITSEDEINDNIKRAQKVMEQNGYFFTVPGLWEPKMQKIAYDYVMNSGPVIVKEGEDKLTDMRRGMHPTLGHYTKFSLFDTLGYIDRDVEKWYASWKATKAKTNDTTVSTVVDTIQNVDIYDGLYDI